jgi:23S rRNA (uracil1939-C5)-methyltransferase
LNEQQVSAGDHLTLSLVSWGRLGEAMAYYQGREVFVFGGIPGERVVAEVIKIRRKYVAARVVQVLEASPQRVEPPCPYYGECTGCQWQHLDYEHQLVVKQERVIDALVRVGGFSHPPVLPVLPSPQQYGYRNHSRFTVGPGGALGFVNRETRRFLRIDHCMLMHQGINHLLAQIQGKCGETTQLSIRAGEATGDYLVQPALKNPDVSAATGQKRYQDSVGGRPFRVSSPSFFQVNVEQAAQLAQMVRRALDLRGSEVLVDAYTGVGTFAVLLAPYVRKVIAVEESPAAVADARENAQGLDNVEFVLGKTEEVLAGLEQKPDALVLDPPRTGCRPEALKGLLRLAPPRVAYVSCDAETLARDLKLLCDGHYTLERVETLDMFPQTHHVECVAVLTHRTGPTDGITLASASPRRQELLAGLGVEFQVAPADVPEVSQPGESADELVKRLSRDKALAVAPRVNGGYVIGADSMVVLYGRALGKPASEEEARRMLRELRGTQHQVITGVTVVHVPSGRCLTDSVTSDVRLRHLSDAEIEASIASGTLMDKAGAYAIQDPVLKPAAAMSGCYSNVVGLPLCRLVEMLRELGCSLPPRSAMAVPGGCDDCPLDQGREQ